MKDHLRDYSTAAFQFYARVGMTADEYKNKIYREALEDYERRQKSVGISFPTEAAIMAAERAVTDKIAAIYDIQAVEFTLNELRCTCGYHILKAIEHVYFKEPCKEIGKGDIQSRVHVAELDIPASERSIYRYLAKARNIFAEKRGLRKEKF